MTRTVLCFGDSNTYGSIPGVAGGRYDREIRWSGVLARELGDGWRVIEEGLPGRTTVFDDPLSPYRRAADYLPPCLGSHAPLDVAIIFLGTNDLKARFAAGPTDIAGGLAVLAQTALASTPHVLLLGLPRLGAELSPSSPAPRRRRPACRSASPRRPPRSEPASSTSRTSRPIPTWPGSTSSPPGMRRSGTRWRSTLSACFRL